ncbi:MAG: DUF885 domain-containing protein [Sphingomonadales bacterium]|nr:MAG: DUF885 domain-containing protein [Sphingomonadales bacterium]
MRANRREFLATAAVAGLAAALPSFARAADSAPFKALLDTMANEILNLSPETATSLGLDSGARAGLKAHLSDRSLAAAQADKQRAKDYAARLATIDRASLSAKDAIFYDAVSYATGLGVEGAPFQFGDAGFQSGLFGGGTPYVVSQQNGALSGVPEFLDSQHKIATRADADAYLSRLAELARALDQETARIQHDAGLGVIPPAFIQATILKQLSGARAIPSAQQRMVTSVAERAKAAGIAGDWAAQADKIVAGQIYPALDRQIAAITANSARATMDAGVWKLPDGDAYYRWLLRASTTTTLDAETIHQTGLTQYEELTARIDSVLKSQGLTQGTPQERMIALTKDPRFLYPNTPEGRRDLIAYINGRLSGLRPLLGKMSKLGLKADVTVKQVPVDIQDGAPLGYMNFAALDGSRPAIYYINLKDTGNWPRWTIPTLTVHEGVPGHTWQGAYLAEHHKDLPLMSSLMGFNAFVEGWALYSEQLADEIGFYKDDPFGELGYLQAIQFRACRLVVDTGLHAKRWTRDQAIDWLESHSGRARAACTSEIDRYCASPGQACGYKIGQNEILRLRAKAQTALGAKFDLRDFNDAIVSTGGVPLTVLETVIDGYIRA